MTCNKCGGSVRYVLGDDALKCADCGYVQFEEVDDDDDYDA